METALYIFVSYFYLSLALNKTIRAFFRSLRYSYFSGFWFATYSHAYLATLISIFTILWSPFSMMSLRILKLFLARSVFYCWCLWRTSNIPSALRGQRGISLSLTALTLTCTLQLYFFGELIPRIIQYATTVSMGSTEWCIAFLCFLGHLFYIWCSWWDCFLVYSSYVATLPATIIVLRWATWCSRVTVLPGILVRVLGSNILSHFMMYDHLIPQLAVELHFVTRLGSSDWKKFLSSVYGLWSYLLMIRCMFVLFRDSGPALIPSWFFGRGTHVVPLACECADSHRRELTMSSWALRYSNTLSWLLSDLHFSYVLAPWGSCISGFSDFDTGPTPDLIRGFLHGE